MSHATPSIIGENTGIRMAHMDAFPRQSLMASCWKMWLVVSDEGRPSLWPWRRPMALIVSTASQLQPPRVSTTKGTKEIPEEWQELECEALFLPSPTSRAWPWVVAITTIIITIIIHTVVITTIIKTTSITNTNIYSTWIFRGNQCPVSVNSMLELAWA